MKTLAVIAITLLISACGSKGSSPAGGSGAPDPSIVRAKLRDRLQTVSRTIAQAQQDVELYQSEEDLK